MPRPDVWLRAKRQRSKRSNKCIHGTLSVSPTSSKTYLTQRNDSCSTVTGKYSLSSTNLVAKAILLADGRKRRVSFPPVCRSLGLCGLVGLRG